MLRAGVAVERGLDGGDKHTWHIGVGNFKRNK